MKLLLDTHAFIWWDSEPHKIPASALAHLQDPANLVLLSVISLWEIQIKSQIGKMHLRLPLADILKLQKQNNGLIELPILSEHVLALDGLPLHHKDPFDRLLIAQAKTEGATLVSNDSLLAAYPVNLLW